MTGMSRAGQVKSAIKNEFGDAIPVAAAQIEIYDSSGNQLIDNWTLLHSLSQEYFTQKEAPVLL